MLEAPVHLWNPHVGCSIQHKMDHSDEAFSGPRNTCLTKKKQPQDQPGHRSTTVPQGIIQQLLECVALKLSSDLLMLHVECYLDPQFPNHSTVWVKVWDNWLGTCVETAPTGREKRQRPCSASSKVCGLLAVAKLGCTVHSVNYG